MNPLRHRPWTQAASRDFNIGLRKIDDAAWLEGGDPQAGRKARLLTQTPDDVWGEMADSLPGQVEVREMVETATGRAADPDLPPLWAASLLCADDLCLMERRETGWALTAISLCSATYFTAAESLGHDLRLLHAPVQDFEAEFLPRVQRMFDAIQPDVIVERCNWTVTASGEAHLPSSAPVRALIPGIAPEHAGTKLHIRIERQTLRRLPRTGGILFTIRPWCDPLNALDADPEARAAFAQAWRGASARFRAYKGLAPYDRLVEAYLG